METACSPFGSFGETFWRRVADILKTLWRHVFCFFKVFEIIGFVCWRILVGIIFNAGFEVESPEAQIPQTNRNAMKPYRKPYSNMNNCTILNRMVMAIFILSFTHTYIHIYICINRDPYIYTYLRNGWFGLAGASLSSLARMCGR